MTNNYNTNDEQLATFSTAVPNKNAKNYEIGLTRQ